MVKDKPFVPIVNPQMKEILVDFKQHSHEDEFELNILDDKQDNRYRRTKNQKIAKLSVYKGFHFGTS